MSMAFLKITFKISHHILGRTGLFNNNDSASHSSYSHSHVCQIMTQPAGGEGPWPPAPAPTKHGTESAVAPECLR